jgi:hypothetical protein
LLRVIVSEQTVEHAAPTPSRQLQAFGNDPFEERFGEGYVRGARLKIAGELHRHRVW